MKLRSARWVRRTAQSLAILAAFALVPSCGDTASERSAASRRVVIAGAGLAGLTAALDLKDAGWDVIVLEARDRVGGRVHTLRDNFTEGLHAEAGGESIDDNHDNIQALALRFGLPLERRPVAKIEHGVIYYGGARSRTLDFVLASPRIFEDYQHFSASLLQLGDGLDPEHPEQFSSAHDLDQRSLADFVATLRLVPEAEFLVRTENRALYASDLEDISLLFAVQQAVVVKDVPDTASETMRIVGGNSNLPEAMAAALGTSLSARCPEMRQRGKSVKSNPPTIAAELAALSRELPVTASSASPTSE